MRAPHAETRGSTIHKERVFDQKVKMSYTNDKKVDIEVYRNSSSGFHRWRTKICFGFATLTAVYLAVLYALKDSVRLFTY